MLPATNRINTQSFLVGGLRIGKSGHLYALQGEHDTKLATLLPRDAELLELFDREDVEVDLSFNEVNVLGADRGPSPQPSWIQAILYGRRTLAPSLKELLNDLDFFLQDPYGSVRDVPYINPQRLFNSPNARTSDPSYHTQRQVTSKEIQTMDILPKFTSSGDLPEIEGSPILLTPLKRFV